MVLKNLTEYDEKYYAELNKKINDRTQYQRLNLEAIKSKRDEENDFQISKLDSNVKKTTNFIKRLKNITEQQKDQLLKDFNNLNLSKYIEEMASSICESKLKMGDIPVALSISFEAHQKYPTFSSHLFTQIQKLLILPSSSDDTLLQNNLSKFRVDLRLAAELIASHLFHREDGKSKGFNLLYNLIKQITELDKEKFIYLNIMINFCKHFSEEYLGIYDEKSIENYMEHITSPYPRFNTFSPNETNMLRTLIFDTYFQSYLINRLKKDFENLYKMNKTNRSIFRNKGELHPDRIERYRDAESNFSKLLTQAKNLSLALYDNNKSLPSFILIPYDSMDDDDKLPSDMKWLLDQVSLENGGKQQSSFDDNASDALVNLEIGYGPAWKDEDEDTQKFYCDLPYLKTLIPGIVCKEPATNQPSNAPSANNKIEKELVTTNLENDNLNSLNGTINKINSIVASKSVQFQKFFDTVNPQNIDNMEPTPENDKKVENSDTKITDTSAKASSKNAVEDDEDTISSLSTLGLNSDLDELDFEEDDFDVSSGNDMGTGSTKMCNYLKKQTVIANEKVKGKASASSFSKAKSGKINNTTANTSAINLMMKAKMDVFLDTLPSKINRDLIDDAAINFLTYLNNKINRKRLIGHLLSVPRNRCDLLPFYSRLACLISQCVPDFGTDLSKKLFSSFRCQLKKKDQINLEVKLKIVRFLSELTKFRIFPSMDMCYCLFLLINDFKFHSIEMICAILENCGRFLVKTLETKIRAKFLLENLKRKKSVTLLDDRLGTLIENAYYSSCPDDAIRSSAGHMVSESVYEQSLQPWQRFMRYLLFEALNRKTYGLDTLVKCFRKFHWDDDNHDDSVKEEEEEEASNNENTPTFTKQSLQEGPNNGNEDNDMTPTLLSGSRYLTYTEEFFVRLVVRNLGEKFRFDVLPDLANVISSLSLYHGDTIGVAVVDDLIEIVRSGLTKLRNPNLLPSSYEQISAPAEQVEHDNSQQTILCAVKLIAEFYNYRLLDTAFLFKFLFGLISYTAYVYPLPTNERPSYGENSNSAEPVNAINGPATASTMPYTVLYYYPYESPTFVFPIHLVLLILETCGTYFDKGSFKKKLDVFLIYFQRYFLEKYEWTGWQIDNPIEGENPTYFPIGCYNYFRDVIETLRPKATLFRSLIEANEAVKAIEDCQKYILDNSANQSSVSQEWDSLIDTSQTENNTCVVPAEVLLLSPNENSVINLSGDSFPYYEDANDYPLPTDEEEELIIDEKAVEEGTKLSDHGSESLLTIESNHNQSNLPYESLSPKIKNCEEDEEFIKSFENMVSDSIIQRAHETVKLQNLDITLPSSIKSKTSKLSSKLVRAISKDNNENNVEDGALSTDDSSKNNLESLLLNGKTKGGEMLMDFVLVCKKGNKPHFRDIKIPFDQKLANRIKSLEEAQRREKEQMKKLTLNINRLQEEEEIKNQILELQQKFPVYTKQIGSGINHVTLGAGYSTSGGNTKLQHYHNPYYSKYKSAGQSANHHTHVANNPSANTYDPLANNFSNRYTTQHPTNNVPPKS